MSKTDFDIKMEIQKERRDFFMNKVKNQFPDLQFEEQSHIAKELIDIINKIDGMCKEKLKNLL